MLDKLEMRSIEQLDVKRIATLFPRHQVAFKPDSQFRNCLIIKNDEGALITLKTNPIWINVHQTKVIVNPSSWNSINDLYYALSVFCDVALLEITRIDHAVDLPLALSYIYERLRVKFKQKGHEYYESKTTNKGILTGFYIGKMPEHYCIYDKRYQLKGQKNCSIILNHEPVTRIELRQYRSKIKNKHLSELVNYLDEPPFNNIEFLEFMPEKNNSERSQLLETILAVDGLYNAYFKLNKTNNFKRDNSKHFIPINILETLNSLYREKLSQFLGVTR